MPLWTRPKLLGMRVGPQEHSSEKDAPHAASLPCSDTYGARAAGLGGLRSYRAAAASLPAKIAARQPQSRQFLKSTFRGSARYFICAGAKAQAPASSAGIATMLRRKTCATPKLEGDPMKIITSLLAASLLLAGINLATAQTGCSRTPQPLPTNPPSTSEGGDASRRLRALTARPLSPIRGRFAPSYCASPKTSPSCSGSASITSTRGGSAKRHLEDCRWKPGNAVLSFGSLRRKLAPYSHPTACWPIASFPNRQVKTRSFESNSSPYNWSGRDSHKGMANSRRRRNHGATHHAHDRRGNRLRCGPLQSGRHPQNGRHPKWPPPPK